MPDTVTDPVADLTDGIQVNADVQLEAVKQIGEVSLSITDLGVAATVFALLIAGGVFLLNKVIKSNDKKDERESERWSGLYSQVLEVVKENTHAQNNAAEAIRDNASATKSIENLVRNIEMERLRSAQSSSSQDAPRSQGNNTPNRA